MDLRWLQQINVDVDENGRAVALQALVKLLGAMTGRTFHRVPVAQAVAGWTALRAKADGKTPKLHYLIGTIAPGGTLQVVSNDADDGSGTDEDLTGAMPLGANGGIPIGPLYAPEFCPTATAGEALGIRTTNPFHGYAVVSTD